MRRGLVVKADGADSSEVFDTESDEIEMRIPVFMVMGEDMDVRNEFMRDIMEIRRQRECFSKQMTNVRE
jgi:hypothetical protein